MRIPPHWAREQYQADDGKGRPRSFAAWGWSFDSLEEARRDAAARAKRIFDFLARGQKPDSYDYQDLPIKEDIIQTITDGASRVALITRNRYGALVLNTANVLFADVDFPKDSPAGLLDSVFLMFNQKKREARRQTRIQNTLAEVERWAASNPAHSFRLYRTREGLRLLFTGRLYEPQSPETAGILQGLNADVMYVKLTQKQECFRARLTSKPWRCGLSRPPRSFPWSNAKAEQAFRQWESRYKEKDSGYRACEFLKEFGRMADIATVKAVVDIHDREARVESGAPLA